MPLIQHPDTSVADPLLSFDMLEGQVDAMRLRYAAADPFPHIVIDNFLMPAAIRGVLDEYPSLDADAWLHYSHYNEKTRSLSDRQRFGPTIAAVFQTLQSQQFVRWLGRLTGFENLVADPSLEAGGLQVSLPGGFLNMHADFTVHPHHRHWARRSNLLLYLNENWEENYGGHLELWSRDMQRRVQRILPVVNRCLIFTTDCTSYHGYPDPITCPPHLARRCLSLYYYTVEDTPPRIQTTDYRARPGEGIKNLWVWLDKKALWAYDVAKRKLGIGDKLGSRLMKGVDRLRGKRS